MHETHEINTAIVRRMGFGQGLDRVWTFSLKAVIPSVVSLGWLEKAHLREAINLTLETSYTIEKKTILFIALLKATC